MSEVDRAAVAKIRAAMQLDPEVRKMVLALVNRSGYTASASGFYEWAADNPDGVTALAVAVADLEFHEDTYERELREGMFK